MKQNTLVSIIVPTYKEAKNIPVLAEKIDDAMKNAGIPYEIIVVDDNSQDGIDQEVSKLKKKYPIDLKIRINERGLSSAVIEGFRIARGDIFVVMDADLSHPPEKIPDMVRPLIEKRADFMIGSRFVPGGSAEHFNWYRRLNAGVSRVLAMPFTRVKDPMAGFFAFPASILPPLEALNPLGFKIGLEVLVKSSPTSIKEIPIQFKERLYGESKLSIKEQVFYILHLVRLFNYKYKGLSEFIRFSLIGGSGMVVDLFFVFLSYQVLSLPFRIARVIGFIFALTMNFLLNRKYTFPHAGNGNIVKQYVSFFAVCCVGFLFNWIISVRLFETVPFFHRFYLFAAFVGILGGLLINFTGSKLFVFRKKG